MSPDIIILLENASIFILDHLVLSEVNFQVNKGEFVYLIGKVGSGKTSVIKTLNAEYPLVEGEGYVSDFELHDLKTSQVPYLRRKLGIVFHDFQLLTDRTVADNLTFVLKATGWKNRDEIAQRISQVLERVGLAHKGYKMPNQLSGGEQQRVVIARALLNDPEIILADEPTGNLDPETSDDIMNILMDIRTSGRTVIMATHNYNMLNKYRARTLKCDDGRLTELEQREIDLEALEE
ncbi:MAG: phosphonate ABC transporter ATP-binding protein [Bacteroides sp. SM23_62]|nr:MAG: phosphonate ABC transporter ATP-binding protein [Bacteroides sp. SM23_62]